MNGGFPTCGDRLTCRACSLCGKYPIGDEYYAYGEYITHGEYPKEGQYPHYRVNISSVNNISSIGRGFLKQLSAEVKGGAYIY